MPINRFNTATFLWLSQARAWISNAICNGLFYVQWFEARGDCCFVDISEIVDNRFLNFLFIMKHCIFFQFYIYSIITLLNNVWSMETDNKVFLSYKNKVIFVYEHLTLLYFTDYRSMGTIGRIAAFR
jgi:hypothetical protein